jgi:hypothetical protein
MPKKKIVKHKGSRLGLLYPEEAAYEKNKIGWAAADFEFPEQSVKAGKAAVYLYNNGLISATEFTEIRKRFKKQTSLRKVS